jgi:hypothetical protein
MKIIYLVMEEDVGSFTGGVPVRAFITELAAESYARRLNLQYNRTYYTVHPTNLYY